MINESIISLFTANELSSYSFCVELKNINIFGEIFLCIAAMYFLLYFTFIRVLKNNKYQNFDYLLYTAVLVLFFSIILLLNTDNQFLFFKSTEFNNSIITDYIGFYSKLLIGASSIIYCLVINSFFKKHRTGQLEYIVLVLLAILGMYLLCSANDLLTAYLAIELQSLSFYLMASFSNQSLQSVEGGLKYFIIGSLSSAFFLFGSSILYGFTGSLCFDDFHVLFLWFFSSNFPMLSFPTILSALSDFELKDDACCFWKQNQNIRVITSKFKILKRYTILNDHDINVIERDVQQILTTLQANDKGKYYVPLSKYITENTFYEKDPYGRGPIYKERFSRIFQKTDFHKRWVDFAAFNTSLGMLYQGSSISNIPSSTHYLDPAISEPSSQTIKQKGFEWFITNSSKAIMTEYYRHFYRDGFYQTFLVHVPVARNMFMLEVLSGLSVVADNAILFFDPDNSHSVELDYIMYSTYELSIISLGLMLILTSIFIKLALAPFHTWSIDVYEGSPMTSTFFFAVISKFSLFVLIVRLCYVSFYSFINFWQFYLGVFAVISIILGAVTAVSQRKLKSLLAYSSITHMGFAVLSLSSGTCDGLQMLFSYLVIYTIAGLCLWSGALSLRLLKSDDTKKHNKDLGEFSLLQKSNPTLAFILMGCLLSIAGIPPMAGFLAKLGVFLTVVQSHFYLTALTLFLVTVVSTFYYLRIVQILYFENVLVGKLYYPIGSQNALIIPILFFILILLFLDPTVLYLLTNKITFSLADNFQKFW